MPTPKECAPSSSATPVGRIELSDQRRLRHLRDIATDAALLVRCLDEQRRGDMGVNCARMTEVLMHLLTEAKEKGYLDD